MNNYSFNNLAQTGLFSNRSHTGKISLYFDGRAMSTDLNTKRPGHFQHRDELDIFIARQRGIQLITPYSGVLRQLIHALGAKNGAECLGNKHCIVLSMINTDIEVIHHLLVRREGLCGVCPSPFDATHKNLQKPLKNVEDKSNKSTLRGTIVTREQDGIRRLHQAAAKCAHRQYGGGVSERNSCALVTLSPVGCNSSMRHNQELLSWVV